MRVESIVAAVVDQGNGGSGEGVVAELTIDLVERDLQVEDVGLLVGVAHAQARVLPEPGHGLPEDSPAH